MKTGSKLVKTFSHTDLDGVGSALLLKAILKTINSFKEATFLPNSYCETGKYGTIDKEILDFIDNNPYEVTHIFITDLCPSLSTLEKLNKYCEEKGIEWTIYDHHKTALEANDIYPSNSNIVVIDEDTGYKHSGTSLIFKELCGVMPHQAFNISSKEKLARFADIVRCYDCWDWATNPHAEYKTRANDFNNMFYLFSYDERKDLVLKVLINGVPFLDNYSEIINALNRKEQEYIDSKCKSAKYDFLDGYTYAYVFAEQYKSTLGNQLAKLVDPETQEPVDFGMVIDGNKLSLRAVKDHVDVSAIANKFFGGGGHQKAAGGRIPEVLMYCTNPDHKEGSMEPEEMFSDQLFLKIN